MRLEHTVTCVTHGLIVSVPRSAWLCFINHEPPNKAEALLLSQHIPRDVSRLSHVLFATLSHAIISVISLESGLSASRVSSRVASLRLSTVLGYLLALVVVKTSQLRLTIV